MTPSSYDPIYWEGKHVLVNLLNIEVPVISAINGPATRHCEIPLLSDIVLASEDCIFQDSAHFQGGMVPGDGVHIVFPFLLGPNRARYFLLMGQEIDALEAKSLGLVNEVMPKEALVASSPRDRGATHAPITLGETLLAGSNHSKSSYADGCGVIGIRPRHGGSSKDDRYVTRALYRPRVRLTTNAPVCLGLLIQRRHQLAFSPARGSRRRLASWPRGFVVGVAVGRSHAHGQGDGESQIGSKPLMDSRRRHLRGRLSSALTTTPYCMSALSSCSDWPVEQQKLPTQSVDLRMAISVLERALGSLRGRTLRPFCIFRISRRVPRALRRPRSVRISFLLLRVSTRSMIVSGGSDLFASEIFVDFGRRSAS